MKQNNIALIARTKYYKYQFDAKFKSPILDFSVEFSDICIRFLAHKTETFLQYDKN